jgi:hydrogenase nickel incorporation protein HypA/HybF
MHEGAVMQTVVTKILATLDNVCTPQVTHIQLELGTSTHFTEEAVRQYFHVLTLGTPIEGAELELSWLPATYQCLSCQQRFESISEPGVCPHCGDIGLEVAHQESCILRSIDVITSKT